MKKIFTLLTLCLCMSATAWADIREEWTNTAPPHSRPIITTTTYPTGLTYSGSNKVHAVTQVIKVETQGDVIFTLTITAGTLNVLGVDLAKVDNEVQARDYTAKELTTSDATYTATLSAVPAGYYVLRYFVHNNTNDNADLDNTTGSLNVTGAVQAPVITDLASLSNDKLYLVKSGRTTATKDVFLLYNSAQNGYLSSNFSQESVNTSLYDGLDKFQFAIYKHTNDKYYFYIPKGYKIVGNATTENTAIPLGYVADTDMKIRKTSTVANYPFMLSTNGSGALNAAATSGQHGVVNWNGGYNQTGDTGNAYQFIEVGSLSADIQTEIANRITNAEAYNKANTLLNQVWESTDNTLVGNYIYDNEKAAALATAVGNFNFSATNANSSALTTAYNDCESNASRILPANGEIFQIKCTDATNNRGYIAYYADGNNEENVSLAGAVFSGQTYPAIDDANVYSGWSVYYYDSKYYLYNAHNGKFVKVVSGIVKYTENITEAATIVLSNTSGSVTEWNLKIYGTSNYLSASVSRGNANGAVRTDTNNNDAGAKFKLIKVTDESGNISTVADDTRNAIARTILLPVLSAMTPKLGSSTGQYTYTGGNEVTDVANINTARSYIDGTVTPTEGQLEAAITNMTGITSSLTLNQPTAGKLYRLKGKATSRYMKSNGANAQMTLSGADTNADNGPATIFMVTADNKLLSYDLGLYVNETRAIGSTVANSNTFQFLESEGGHVGYYTIKSNYSSAPYLWGGTSGSGSDIVYKTDRNGTYADGNCDWEIEEVTWLPVRIYDDTYKLGTFYSPVPLSRKYYGERVKVYTGAVTNNFFNLTELTSDVLPANTAFVIEYLTGKASSDQLTGTRANEEYVFLPVASAPTLTTEQQAQLTSNQLQGQFETTTPTSAGKTVCTMQVINSALTFARYTGTTVKGFRAYLPVDASTAEGGVTSFRLVFGGIPTGIDAIGTQPAEGQTIYDLSGRRVERATKGLYIVNGKKVMIK